MIHDVQALFLRPSMPVKEVSLSRGSQNAETSRGNAPNAFGFNAMLKKLLLEQKDASIEEEEGNQENLIPALYGLPLPGELQTTLYLVEPVSNTNTMGTLPIELDQGEENIFPHPVVAAGSFPTKENMAEPISTEANNSPVTEEANLVLPLPMPPSTPQTAIDSISQLSAAVSNESNEEFVQNLVLAENMEDKKDQPNQPQQHKDTRREETPYGLLKRTEEPRGNAIEGNNAYGLAQRLEHIPMNRGTVPTPLATGLEKPIYEQIAEQARFTSLQGKTELMVQLKPESLGTIWIKLIHEKGDITAKIITGSTGTRSLLLNEIPDLTQTLRTMSPQVKSVEVLLGQGGLPSDGREHRGRNNQSSAHHHPVQNPSTEEQRAQEKDEQGRIRMIGRSIDYLI